MPPVTGAQPLEGLYQLSPSLSSPGQKTAGRCWKAEDASQPGNDTAVSLPVQPPADSQTRRPASVRAAGSRFPGQQRNSGWRQGVGDHPTHHKIQLSKASLSFLSQPPPPGGPPGLGLSQASSSSWTWALRAPWLRHFS